MAEQQVRTAFAQGLIDLTVLQSMFKPGDDRLLVEDLHDYASRRLREEMLADHPVDANYFSDDLLLTIDTFANDLHDLGIGQKIESKTITLTELAIARLTATNDGVITHIGHRENQLIMGWMNTRYVRELVSRIDIGRTYPLHVKGLLDDEALRGQRIATFAGHWRLTLLFDALRARVVNQLDQAAYHALGRFCRQGADDGADVRIAPLAFKRSLTSHQVECVHGMYVIELRDVPALLLYCPLLPNSLYQSRMPKPCWSPSVSPADCSMRCWCGLTSQCGRFTTMVGSRNRIYRTCPSTRSTLRKSLDPRCCNSTIGARRWTRACSTLGSRCCSRSPIAAP